MNNSITAEALTRLIHTPLLGPDNTKVVFEENDWAIIIDKGLGELRSVNLKAEKFIGWRLGVDSKVIPIKRTEEGWLPVALDDTILQQFGFVEAIINRKLDWNNQYIQTINRESLWKLVWLFRNEQEEAEFEDMAITICERVVYAAAHPFAYVFARYPEDGHHRGLADNPEWIPAAAFLDSVIQHDLAQEITQRIGLDNKRENRNPDKQGPEYEMIEPHYKQPIDKPYLQQYNAELAVKGVGYVRLDVGIRSLIIVTLSLDKLEALNQLMHPLGIYPKYFLPDNPNEETLLKEFAGLVLTAASNNEWEHLNTFRQHQELLWNHIYNERGEVVFWQYWIQKLHGRLLNIAFMHPELKYWLDWCERYETVRKGSNIILPG